MKQSYPYVIKLLNLTAAGQKNNFSSTIEKRPRKSELSYTLLRKRQKGKEHEEENVSSYWMTLRNDAGSTRLHSLENSLWKWLWTCRKAECLMNMQVCIFFWASEKRLRKLCNQLPTCTLLTFSFYYWPYQTCYNNNNTFSMAGRWFTLINFTQQYIYDWFNSLT